MKKILTFMMMSMLASLVFLTAYAQDMTDPTNQLGEEEINTSSEDQNEKEEGLTEQDEQVVDETNLSPTPDEKYETHQVVLNFSDNDLMDTYRISY